MSTYTPSSSISTKTEIHEYEVALASQFSQTADSKAEQKLIEWLVLNFSYYEEETDSKEDEEKKENKGLFPLFEGESYEAKRKSMILLQETDDAGEDVILHKLKRIFDNDPNDFGRTVIALLERDYGVASLNEALRSPLKGRPAMAKAFQ